MKFTSLAFSVVHDLLVIVHTEDDPRDDEWEKWIDFNHTIDKTGSHRGTLVVSHGGSPNGLQRRGVSGLSKAMRDRPVAIMMDSRIRALMVTAIGVLGQNVKGFRFGDWEAMTEYLVVTSTESEDLRVAVRQHRQQLGITE